MNSSRNSDSNILLSIYKVKRSVFRLIDIAQMTGETNFKSLNKKLNYYVRTGRIRNPRKGIYTKPDYDPAELACIIYTPSYISLEYVLQRSGIIFQYSPEITTVSYLSRSIIVEEQTLVFRKVKGEILVNTTGINRLENHVNIASPERAFLDMLYLSPDYYFDNLKPLNRKNIDNILPVYNTAALVDRVRKIIYYD